MTKRLVDELLKVCPRLGELDAEDVLKALVSRLDQMVSDGHEFKDLEIITQKKTGAFVPDTLRRFRERASLSRAEVAEQMECSVGKISGIENNRVGVTLPWLNGFIQLYDIPDRWAGQLRRRRTER